MISFDGLVSRLDKTRRHPGYVTARCPAHPDRSPSLSVRNLDDGIAIKCFAGCDTIAIAAALGIDPKDLRHDPDDTPKILDVYPYVGPDGEDLFEVVRYVPKAFKQRRRHNGRWVYNLNGIQRVPYRLPELREGIEAGRWVILVEGEKDVHRLSDEGFCATTTPQGAAAWSDEYAEWFAGGLVAIIPDNDPQGEEYAAQAATAIAKVAREVRVISLPGLEPKSDVNDWLYTHTASDLQELIRTTTAYGGGELIPEIELGPDSVKMTWPHSDVVAVCDRLTWQAGQVHGEVTVIWAGRALIEYQRVNTQSASARRDLVTELNRYDRDIEWHVVLSRLFGEGVRRYRSVGRLLDMRNRPKSEPPRFLIGDMWPDMARPSLIFGDGQSAKSTISLALILSLASGHPLIAGADPLRIGPVAYLDYEDDEELFDHRLQTMTASAGVDLLACQPIHYHRPSAHLHQIADSLGGQLRSQEVLAVVIDSRSGAQSGSLINDDDTRLFIDAVMSLGPRAWIIDHLDKEAARRAKAPKHSYGSVFLRNRVASSWFVKTLSQTPTQTTVSLTDAKWNHGPKREARTLVVDWAEGLRIDRRGQPMEAPEPNTLRERFIELLLEEGSMNTPDLCGAAGCSRETGARVLRRHKTDFVRIGDYDLWTLTPEAHSEASVEAF